MLQPFHNIIQLMSFVNGPHNGFKNKALDVGILVFQIEFEVKTTEHNSSPE